MYSIQYTEIQYTQYYISLLADPGNLIIFFFEIIYPAVVQWERVTVLNYTNTRLEGSQSVSYKAGPDSRPDIIFS